MAVIEVEQPAEAFRLHHSPFLLKGASVGKRNGIVDPRMTAFGVIVRQARPDHMLQGAIAEEDEPLRNRIQVWGVWREFHDRDPGGVQNPVKRVGVFRIAVVDR
ncbi:MAG: hypothetical protein ABSD58_16240 [Verrucomicrobiia bacterium]|jgi:hypothetical protein